MRPIPFVLAASDHGPLIVNRNDFNKTPDGMGMYGVGFQILSSGSYDGNEVNLIRSILFEVREQQRPAPIVAFDCGANIGVMTIEIARFINGWGRVIAFEAQERIFYALCGNIALANLFNASAIHAAVGKIPGTMGIPVPDYTRPASFGSLELVSTNKTEFIGQRISYAPRDMTKVSVQRIDDSVPPGVSVGFIKIDVEGMELEVLAGAKQTIQEHKPILLIEWIKVGKDLLIDTLTNLDYIAIEHGANLLAKPRES